MSLFTLHIYHPRQIQTSVYDYESWAHPRPSRWEQFTCATLEEASIKAKELRARALDGDHISDHEGNKYEVES